MAGDLPQFASSSYASNTMDVASLFGAGDFVSTGGIASDTGGAELARAMRRVSADPLRPMFKAQAQEMVMANPVTARRLVKVIVIDPNENVPLDKCVLYSGDEKLTDLNDQELFFELDIKILLTKHNEERVKLVDKKVKERTEHLEPARIRDLKMVVVNIAQF